jgi:hypothetical protein
MTNSNLVLSQPEAEATGMVAPGQEALLDEFVAEQEQEEQQRILGKFNSPEELAKAYQELEKKLGQPKQTDPAEAPSPVQGYTAEQAVQTYGQEAVEALAGKGVDLADVMWKADNGQDISEHYDALAETFGVSRQVVENYVSKAQTTNTDANTTTSLSDTDAAELKAMVGGEDGFQQLSQWAANNLQPQELADYNAVVDSGNKAAISWALKAIQARVAAPDAVVEPKLIGGGEVPAAAKFESQQQVLDAMNKRNDRGQKLYDVDDAYRQKVKDLLARSDVF